MGEEKEERKKGVKLVWMMKKMHSWGARKKRKQGRMQPCDHGGDNCTDGGGGKGSMSVCIHDDAEDDDEDEG